MSDKIDKVYKYCSINEFLFLNLINKEFYFSNPMQFNDPYDSTPRFKVSNKKENVKRFFVFLRNSVKGYESFLKENLIFDKRLQDLIEIINFYKIPDIFEKMWKEDLTKLQITLFNHYRFIFFNIHNYGVFCTSKLPDCPLMWSHYANNHKGICLELLVNDEDGKPLFDFEVKETESLLKEVDYSDIPIDFFENKLPSEDANINVRLAVTKSSKWNYEEEIRFVARTQGTIKFNPKCLTKIIFGSRTTAKEKYTLCSLVSNYYGQGKTELGFYKSEKLFDEYKMTMTQMTLNDIAGIGIKLEELNLSFDI